MKAISGNKKMTELKNNVALMAAAQKEMALTLENASFMVCVWCGFKGDCLFL